MAHMAKKYASEMIVSIIGIANDYMLQSTYHRFRGGYVSMPRSSGH
jgi:hypothetical protein